MMWDAAAGLSARCAICEQYTLFVPLFSTRRCFLPLLLLSVVAVIFRSHGQPCAAIRLAQSHALRHQGKAQQALECARKALHDLRERYGNDPAMLWVHTTTILVPFELSDDLSQ